ncbi:MAG: HPr family phosphocarrier protein [Longimicrobiales bacterium]
MSDRLTRTMTIVNRAGMHARPAAEFVKVAGKYTSSILVEKDGLEVNGKSIMGVLMLAAEQGSRLTVSAEGADAEAALDDLGALLGKGFFDEEAR